MEQCDRHIRSECDVQRTRTIHFSFSLTHRTVVQSFLTFFKDCIVTNWRLLKKLEFLFGTSNHRICCKWTCTRGLVKKTLATIFVRYLVPWYHRPAHESRCRGLLLSEKWNSKSVFFNSSSSLGCQKISNTIIYIYVLSRLSKFPFCMSEGLNDVSSTEVLHRKG